MSCEWADKISALTDGELTADETRAAEEHLRACAACRETASSFRALGRELGSYAATVDAATQRRVLTAVLSSKSTRSREREPRQARGLLAALFGARTLSPAMTAAAGLLITAAALGLFVYFNSRRATTNVNSVARDDTPAAQQSHDGGASVVRQENAPQETRPAPSSERRQDGGAGIDGAPRAVAAEKKRQRRVVAARGERRRATDTPDEATLRAPEEANKSASAQTAVTVVASSSSPGADALDAARHAEQAQMLLRSFRNARLDDGGMAYERERSKKLLYRNIVLRREAASRRDATVAQALDRLEPILLDIANLPANPAEEDVNPIRERMRKKNILVLLQASTTARKRSY